MQKLTKSERDYLSDLVHITSECAACERPCTEFCRSFTKEQLREIQAHKNAAEKSGADYEKIYF